jgi:predicted AAA+ superfamily ATPase
MELFTEYCLIGGMPEVLKHYLENSDIVAVGKIFDSLITGYLDDVEKYTISSNQTVIIRHIISNAIKLAGERITFEGFASSKYKSRDVGECFRILEKTFLLSLIYPTTGTKIPILENIRKSPKLHILDTGILNYYSGTQFALLSNQQIDSIFEGKIAEHIVGQELLSLRTSATAKNNFWVKENNQANAEVDYVYQSDDLLIPIEVKLGKTGRLRSLMEYMDACPHHFAVRIYSGQLSFQEAQTIRLKKFKLLNLPFYLISKLPEYIHLMKKNDVAE